MHAEEKEDTRSPGPREKPKRKDANLTGYGTMIENPDVIRLCTELGMSRQDVWQLRKEFNDEDSDSTDTITLTSFFFLIQEQNRDLTKALLRLAVKEGDQPPTRRLTFDEYLRCVVTFSSFTEIQVFQFFFQVYADITQQRSGGTTVITVGEDELVQLSQDLQMLQFAFAGNIQVAQAHFAPPSASPIGTSMENWTFTDFESFARQHRVAFYPLIRVQHNVRRAGGFSDGYWAKRIKERQVLAHVLTYMKKNHGLLPKLPWRDRIWSAVMQNPTTVKRVHDRAKNFYMSSQQ
ncbi:hypothetical protein Poli38472_008750 [Pythium oligandrum]|uniref:Uncharacterized protein n=1 Tax=Pythium oligandrum TaxID=41045 RepID=A0A8K1FDZ4_PYTOL|nr:hypothetical protein Poli38472_008750 [Pythium oligandrum]|eukprot:TMW56102.1 hypothetical protein Poli38472_008750 [Pythium oligandrum]